ncbi:DEAD/DEAH box helicase, partial [Bradyrhizobium sp. SZCCHNS2005]|uniref:DEAD/DEAH box helicase n=1 Tax=Bradyrhizobium sp. SZCCHNS2005 TaxID=3057303 RepID=UPI0028E994C1
AYEFDKPAESQITASSGRWDRNDAYLLAEFALVESLQSQAGLSVYLVPYIALGNQVMAALKRHLPESISLIGVFGGYEGEAPAIVTGGRTVLVATPERFDLLLRTASIIDALKLVIVDEAHLLESGVRGARLEGILSRLLLKQHSLPNLRLLLVSAVLQDITALSTWLKIDGRYFHDGWRPTSRRVAF